jgi:FkbM family methyltransferase
MQNPHGRVPDEVFTSLARDPSTIYSYSQFGEDIILEFYLGGRRAPGFFVDVGAYHPKRYSNTYLLYLRGWRGINIDADPDVISLFNAERPRDQNIMAAIGGAAGVGSLIRFNEKAFNTLHAATAEKVLRHPAWKLQDTIRVETYRLADVLRLHVPTEQRIDVMNIDIEGADLAALHGNDWDRFAPEFLIIEDHSFAPSNPHGSDIFRFLSDKQYALLSHAVYSLIFRRAQPSISRQA